MLNLEFQKLLLICGTLVLCTTITSCTAKYGIDRWSLDRSMTQSIKSGADPIAVGCAFRSNGTDPMCLKEQEAPK